MMAKETKYGLCLIAVLFVGLVGAIIWRVNREMKVAGGPAQPPSQDVSAAADKPAPEPAKLVLRAADSDRLSGDALPPTAAAPVVAASEPVSIARLTAATEPTQMPPRHRYPLMPAAAAADPAPTLAANDSPPTNEELGKTHTSFRPEDTEPAAAAEPSNRYAGPAVAAPTERFATPAAEQQPAERSRYREPEPAVAMPAAEPIQRQPAVEPHTFRQSEPRFGGTRSIAPAPRQFAQAADRDDGTAVVRPNDTFWTISERAYGSGAYFKALIRYNSEKHPMPDRLAVGETVLVPPVSELTQKYPQLCPKPRHAGDGGIRNVAAPMTAPGSRAYEVREGNTLFDIARFELGDGARWTEIYQLNRDQLTDDFHYLKPGSTLVLPGRHRQPADRVAREPSDIRRQ